MIAAFPEQPRTALLVANCESGLNQDARGPTRDFGLFQVHEPTWDQTAKQLGLDYKNKIVDNIEMARHIYDAAGQSWQPWVCWWHEDHLAMR